MTFDYTHGQTPKYLVSVYGFNVEDKYYYHYYHRARLHFMTLIDRYRGMGFAISISDLITDERKEFFKE